MNLPDNYEFYISLIACLLFAVFLFVGSIVALKSKRNLCSTLLVISSGIGLFAIIASCYLAVKFNEIVSNTSSSYPEDYMINIEELAEYQNISSYSVLFSYCLFAFIFVVFCSNIANIRKRNEQLELLVEQLKENR